MGIRAGSLPMIIAGEELIGGGDIVLEVGGIAIAPEESSFDQIFAYLTSLEVGDTIRLKVLREGRIVSLTAVRTTL
jgi:S1-C subfamily serine protease